MPNLLLLVGADQEDDEDDEQDGAQAHDEEREVGHQGLYEKQLLKPLHGGVVYLHVLMGENHPMA